MHGTRDRDVLETAVFALSFRQGLCARCELSAAALRWPCSVRRCRQVPDKALVRARPGSAGAACNDGILARGTADS